MVSCQRMLNAPYEGLLQVVLCHANSAESHARRPHGAPPACAPCTGRRAGRVRDQTWRYCEQSRGLDVVKRLRHQAHCSRLQVFPNDIPAHWLRAPGNAASRALTPGLPNQDIRAGLIELATRRQQVAHVQRGAVYCSAESGSHANEGSCLVSPHALLNAALDGLDRRGAMCGGNGSQAND